MSVAPLSATPTPAPPPAPATAALGPARTASGDYKTANPRSAQTRDSDGDYKPSVNLAAAQSTPGVQASLTSLKVGG